MPGFAIRRPYLIIVACLIIAVVGTTAVVRMPVDLFPAVNIPVVVVATFFAGMPPEQIEAIELAFFKGMTHQEIAAHLRQPLGTIKSRIRGGLQMLRGIWLREMR